MNAKNKQIIQQHKGSKSVLDCCPHGFKAIRKTIVTFMPHPTVKNLLISHLEMPSWWSVDWSAKKPNDCLDFSTSFLGHVDLQSLGAY